MSHAMPFFVQEEALVRVVSGLALTGFRCAYDIDAYRDDLFADLGLALPAELRDAVVKRRSEYLAGRYCARHVMKALGYGDQELPAKNAAQPAPVWPDGLSASISHTHTEAICLGTTERKARGVGVDIECVMAPDVATSISSQVIDRREAAILFRHFGTENKAVTVAFSAKESLYKAAVHLTKRNLGFHSFRLDTVDAERIVFRLDADVSDDFPVEFPLAVSYSFASGTVETAACFVRP
jgi:enterobactin synthetase component D